MKTIVTVPSGRDNAKGTDRNGFRILPQVNRHEAFWRESVLANTRLDVWFLNLNTLHGIMQKPGKLGLNNPQVLKLQQVLNEWKENAR